MSSRRRFAGHARAKGNIEAKRVLEEREPFLVPLPLPFISPSASPIGSDTPTPALASPSPTPTSSSGGGGDDGGSNGNGGGSGSGGQSGGNGNGSGGSGNGGGSNGSSGPSGAPSTRGGGTSSPGNGSGGNSAGPTNTSSPAESTSETDANQSTSHTTSASLSPGLANVGSSPSSVTPSVNIAVTSTSSNGVPATAFSSGVAAGTGNLGEGSNDTGNESTGAISQSHNLSAGGIGGIVIALLIVGVATLVVVLRRRAVARRVERREAWFNREAVGTGLYGNNESPRNSATGGRRMGSSAATRSARSSFATTFDQSQSPHLDMNFAFLPPIPPMAEIRGEGPLVLGLDSSFENSRRTSGGSNSSTASDPNSQFLLLPPIARDNEMIGTPMSVRPFSPSESYSFPKPPPEANASRGSVFSYLQSNGVGEREDNSKTSTATSPTVCPSGTDANPFADPTPAEIPMQAAFSEIEVIRRPFMPKLQDELIVAVGDNVRIVQMFDDGWAMVQKIPPPADKKGKARAMDESDQGLIPIDCLRDANQALPEFIAQKRVSGYAGDSDTNAL